MHDQRVVLSSTLVLMKYEDNTIEYNIADYLLKFQFFRRSRVAMSEIFTLGY